MEIVAIEINNHQIAEIVSDEMIIHTADDGLDLMGTIYFQGFDKLILYQKNITPTFFDLKTKMAGEILQKFSNYRISLAIVGDFGKYPNKSINDFIRESNKLGHINFVASKEEAIEKLTKN
jgi:hypothetical protein